MGYVQSMTSRLRLLAAVGTAVAVLSATVGCGAEPPANAWVLAPMSYDNRMDGDSGPSDVIDASYPMSLVSDTAGGFWGVSAGSWLHIDETGAAVTRFNLDPGAPGGAVDAVTPTVLAVVSGAGAPHPGTIVLFDTDTMSWDELHRDERALGDIATTRDAVYFVAYTPGESTFTIEKLALTPGAKPVTVSPALDGQGPVAIDVDNSGMLYVATPTERIILGPDGVIRSSDPVPSIHPGVSVNDRGDVVWSGEAATTAALPTFVSGGSAEARRIIDTFIECDPNNPPFSTQGIDHLTVSNGEESLTLPFLCSPSGFTWINDQELVVSVGDEGGAPLVRVTPPSDSGPGSQTIR